MNKALLIVLDGFGMAAPGPGNAIQLANPTHINTYLHTYPNTTLRASGDSVGLPANEVGNTEVGHINLGAGRIVYQDLPRINMSIADGSFYENKALLHVVEHLKRTGGKLHIIGLIGHGSVHSSLDHLYALLFFAKEQSIPKVRIHAITDGRDSPPKSAMEVLQQVEEHVKKNVDCCIASVMGRYFSMDRDRRWERTEKAYNCLTKGEGLMFPSVQEVIEKAYKDNKTDEFVEPSLITREGIPVGLIEKGDSVIFFNFRIDRPRQLTKAFVLDKFEQDANLSASFDPYEVKYYKKHLHEEAPAQLTPAFPRGPKIEDLLFVTMTEYEKNLPVDIAFPQITIAMPLGRVLSEHGVSQLRMSESEKERFVTFYFNGQRNISFPQEDRIIISSPKVATYDLQPEMSANAITDELIKQMHTDKYTFILVNFANPDMVGHTGNIEATIKAIQTIDNCMGRIVAEALISQYTVFITADHGNAEQKINPQTGGISTEHTGNPVPFVAISSNLQGKFIKLQSGILADVAPTILAVMGIPKPSDMTGRNLLEQVGLSS